MWRPGAALAALGLATCLVPGVALAQQGVATAPLPVPAATPPTATVVRSDVRLAAGRAVRHLDLRVPGAPDGMATVTWEAYAGSRSARELARVGHGRVQVQVRGGAMHFTHRVRAGAGFGRSAGFCEQVDLSGVGAAMPDTSACPTGDTATRDQIPARVPEFSMYSDSVGAGLLEAAGATTQAAGPYSAVFDLKVCRRLTYLPCPPNPPSAVASIRAQAGSVGDIAVIDVGYNDWAQVYDVEQAVSALRARGVRRIVWVTLREVGSGYGSINAMIRQTAKRHPGLVQIADWNAASQGLEGFAADGVHLSSGSTIDALAGFVRREVGEAVAQLEGQ